MKNVTDPFNSPWCKSAYSSNSWRGKELKQFCPTRSSDDLCLLFYINPSSVYGGYVSWIQLNNTMDSSEMVGKSISVFSLYSILLFSFLSWDPTFVVKYLKKYLAACRKNASCLIPIGGEFLVKLSLVENDERQIFYVSSFLIWFY